MGPWWTCRKGVLKIPRLRQRLDSSTEWLEALKHVSSGSCHAEGIALIITIRLYQL